MGQAKQRKASDPLYGKPDLDQASDTFNRAHSPTLRGLIVSNPIKIEGTTLSSSSPHLDVQDLRSSLLYWDRLSWPKNPIIGSPPNNDEKFLRDEGVLIRPKTEIKGGGQITDIFQTFSIALLQHYEKTLPGIWSIGNSTNSILVNEGAKATLDGTLLQLYNAIPVPAANVPLNEILEFKQKRHAELLSLRAHFKSLVTEIQGSADSVDALNSKLAEVDHACANLISVTREWQVPVKLSSINASLNFNIGKGFESAAKAWTAAGDLGLGQTGAVLAAVAAGIQSQIKISPDISLRSIRKGASPFRYAYLIERDLRV